MVRFEATKLGVMAVAFGAAACASGGAATTGGAGGTAANGAGGTSASTATAGVTTSSTTTSVVSVVSTGAVGAGGFGGAPAACDPPAPAGSFYAQTADHYGDIALTSMCDYRGDVVLVVNTAAV